MPWIVSFTDIDMAIPTEFTGIQTLFIYISSEIPKITWKLKFTFLTFQRLKLKPKPINRFGPNLKTEGL